MEKRFWKNTICLLLGFNCISIQVFLKLQNYTQKTVRSSGGPTETLYKCGDRSRGGTHANQTTQETPPVNKFEDKTQTNGGIHARKSGGIHANHQEDKNAQERPPVYKCGD